MNNIVTSKEDILKASRELIKRKGLNAINIRSVADEANIAVGSIYNYFKSKEELTIAVIVSVWADIFHSSDISLESESFINSIDSIFKILEKGDKKYPRFFALHSTIIFGKNKDKCVNVMMDMIKHIKDNMYKTIINDKNIAIRFGIALEINLGSISPNSKTIKVITTVEIIEIVSGLGIYLLNKSKNKIVEIEEITTAIKLFPIKPAIKKSSYFLII